MPFPPCQRCGGYMALGEDRRETYCLMCGAHRYNVPTLGRAALDREEKERREKYYARGSGRRRLMGGGPSLFTPSVALRGSWGSTFWYNGQWWRGLSIPCLRLLCGEDAGLGEVSSAPTGVFFATSNAFSNHDPELAISNTNTG